MSKERKNFYRIYTIIVENGRECLANLLEVDLSTKKLSLTEFIDLNKHDIHHLCYNKYPCCQCNGGQLPPNTPPGRILHTNQLNIIFDKRNRISGHVQSMRTKECCFHAKKNVTLDDFDIILARCMLINFATICQPVRQAVDALIKLRNDVYGHAMETSLTGADFLIHKGALNVAILEISKACGKEEEMRGKLDEVYRRPLDEAMCMQYQNLLLEDIRQQQENEEANRCYLDTALNAICNTAAWIVSKITRSNQLSSTTVQDDIRNNSDTSDRIDVNINIKTEPLEEQITEAVKNVLEKNRIQQANNRTTQHDANDRMQPGNTIPPNDNDSTNGDCVLQESEIDKLKREKKELERKYEEMKRKIDNLERKRKAQTDESDDNDAGQVRPKRVQRTPNTK